MLLNDGIMASAPALNADVWRKTLRVGMTLLLAMGVTLVRVAAKTVSLDMGFVKSDIDSGGHSVIPVRSLSPIKDHYA